MFQLTSNFREHQSYIDFYISPISGAEAVLRMQWLKTPGPVITDYSNLTVKITWEERDINMHRITAPTIEEISSNLKKIHSIDSIAAFYYLEMSNISSNSLPTFSSLPSFIQRIL